MKYLYLIFFLIIINSSAVNAKDANLKQLEKIEKKLFNNKEIYLELLKVEKEVKKNLSEAKSNVLKYKKLIKQGYSEKQFLEEYIQKKNKSLVEISALKSSIKSNKSLLLSNVLISKYKSSYSEKRDSILKIAKEKGISVEERKIAISEIMEAHQNGTLKEAFGVGTAVAVNPINSITFREEKIEIEAIGNSYAHQLKSELQNIQQGVCPDTHNWIVTV